MASASLATMHTACVRLRDALDRWLAAFEVVAGEAAAEGLIADPKQSRAARPLSESSAEMVALACRPGGITPTEAAEVLQRFGRAGNQNIGAERLRDLAQAGHITRLPQPGRRVRYFGSTDAALTWLARQHQAAQARTEPAEHAAELPELPDQPQEAGVLIASKVCDLPAVMNGVDFDAVHRRQPESLAQMVAGAADAVEKAMAVISPTPRAPRQKAAPSPAQRPPGSEASNATRDASPRLTGEPIGMDTAPVTRAPRVTHDPRYQVDPATQPFGAGFAAVGPGRDINTGKAWER